MSVLRVEDLSLTIGGTPILREVGLSVEPGQVLGLVGESGSGKSMTALAVMGLLPARARLSGTIALGGQRLIGLPERAYGRIRGARIGMVFQEPMTALNPLMTIEAQVAEVIRRHAGPLGASAAARAALERVGLTPDRVPPDRYPHELSGGQRQRVVIAMAVVMRPAIVIADEPTSALDVTTQARILELLRRLVAEDGIGLMLISHDLAVVARMADRIAVMQAGRIVEAGPTHRVLGASRHPYTRALIRAATHSPTRTPPERGDTLLRLDGVHCTYPARRRGLWRRGAPMPAVRGVDLTLAAGESLGLVGESGCGKSTLTRAILGLQPISAGRITLFGRRVDQGMPRALRAGIQIVFQDPYGSFDPRWRVARLVAEPFHLMPRWPEDWRQRVAAALAEVGLPADAMDRYPHEFSGGQRQRIAIARALVTRPEIIVLDEPVSALDVSVRARILDLLAALQQRLGLAYLFVSHDLAVVRAITDRVMVMRAGRIVEDGPTARVLSAPRHAYTRALIAAAPSLKETA